MPSKLDLGIFKVVGKGPKLFLIKMSTKLWLVPLINNFFLEVSWADISITWAHNRWLHGLSISADHSSFVKLLTIRSDQIADAGSRRNRAGLLPAAAGRPTPAAAHWSILSYVDSLPWRQTLAWLVRLSPKTLEAVPNGFIILKSHISP